MIKIVSKQPNQPFSAGEARQLFGAAISRISAEYSALILAKRSHFSL
jgi:hypothetical protein